MKFSIQVASQSSTFGSLGLNKRAEIKKLQILVIWELSEKEYVFFFFLYSAP